MVVPLVRPVACCCAGATAGDARSNGALAYEWLTEQGYALQIGAHIAPLLRSEVATRTMEDRFHANYPEVALPPYDGSITRSVRRWVELYADNVLLIYGQYDPWSGGALDEPTRPTSARFFAPAQAHSGAQIAMLAEADRAVALEHASRMFGVPPAMALMQRASAAAYRRSEILMRVRQRSSMRMP